MNDALFNRDNTLLVATRNKGKLLEFRELLDSFPVRVRGIGEFPSIPDAVEDGETFEANALKKAEFAAERSGRAVIADDSGLVVPALGGAPGVHSSRYAGEGAGDRENVGKLLDEMREITDRSASFVCVIALVLPGGGTFMYKGFCEGKITGEPKGHGGFGYDPVFFYPLFSKTFAEMALHEKNRVSHRGQAMLAFFCDFDRVLRWFAASPDDP